jgi:hypothetical protein
VDERQRAEGLELPEIHFFSDSLWLRQPASIVTVTLFRRALLSRSRNRASAIASNGMEAL